MALFTKGSGYNQTYTFWDLFRGRGGRTAEDAQTGFIFVQQSGRTNSGQNVDVDNLLEEPTTLSCINAITQGVNQIPIYVCRYNEDGTKEVVRNHPIELLMRRPNDYQTPTEFKSSIVTSMLTHGNAYIRLVKSGGRVAQLYPLDPSDITIGSNALGRPVYTHEDYAVGIPADEIVHIRDLTTYVPQGISRAIQAAELIGAKLAADQLIAETFKNGSSVQYSVNSDVPIDASKLENLQEQMARAFGQGGGRRGGVAFVEQGSIQKIDGVKPADLDLRELRSMLINEIAAVFRVPAFMVGGSGDQTYNNVRQYWSAFHRDTLQPIVTNIEEAFSLKLLQPDEFLFFDTGELLKGDVEVTARIAQANVSSGIWTPNEGRLYIGTARSDQQVADLLIPPNSTTTATDTVSTTTTLDEPTPENATGGPDGPQGRENAGENDGQ